MYTYTYTYTYIHIYIYIYVRVTWRGLATLQGGVRGSSAFSSQRPSTSHLDKPNCFAGGEGFVFLYTVSTCKLDREDNLPSRVGACLFLFLLYTASTYESGRQVAFRKGDLSHLYSFDIQATSEGKLSSRKGHKHQKPVCNCRHTPPERHEHPKKYLSTQAPSKRHKHQIKYVNVDTNTIREAQTPT